MMSMGKNICNKGLESRRSWPAVPPRVVKEEEVSYEDGPTRNESRPGTSPALPRVAVKMEELSEDDEPPPKKVRRSGNPFFWPTDDEEEEEGHVREVTIRALWSDAVVHTLPGGHDEELDEELDDEDDEEDDLVEDDGSSPSFEPSGKIPSLQPRKEKHQRAAKSLGMALFDIAMEDFVEMKEILDQQERDVSYYPRW